MCVRSCVFVRTCPSLTVYCVAQVYAKKQIYKQTPRNKNPENLTHQANTFPLNWIPFLRIYAFNQLIMMIWQTRGLFRWGKTEIYYRSSGAEEEEDKKRTNQQPTQLYWHLLLYILSEKNDDKVADKEESENLFDLKMPETTTTTTTTKTQSNPHSNEVTHRTPKCLRQTYETMWARLHRINVLNYSAC